MTTALQRTVLVIGRGVAKPPRLYPEDVDGSMSLVMIVVGWPLSPAQTTAVDEGLALARDRGIVFDAILAGSLADGLDEVSSRDRVLYAADRREGRRLTRALDGRGITARVAR